MANIKDWLLEHEAEYGETIECVVVGVHDNNRYGRGEPNPDENIMLSREAALAKLDLEFDDGYGSAECYPLTAWTKSRVLYIREYDGSTGLSWQHRNPVNHKPRFS